MAQNVVDAYPTIWHYTSEAGLDGILRSNHLWATNYRFLNDQEELRGFFSEKLPSLLESGTQLGYQMAVTTPSGRTEIAKAGSAERYMERFRHAFHSALKSVTLDLSVYVTSFCYMGDGPDYKNGLLSQWRGYGRGGGYAIVFETLGLYPMFEEERQQYNHPFTSFGDVDYYDMEFPLAGKRHEETMEWENAVVNTVVEIVSGEVKFEEKSDSLFQPVVALATRHKHYGFREEAEVRLSLVLWEEHQLRVLDASQAHWPVKKIFHMDKDGIQVPYVKLFDGIPDEKRRLPIKEIVVGPHPEKMQRAEMVKALLMELGSDALVRVSEIPYIGR
jgi:hypothetical protein